MLRRKELRSVSPEPEYQEDIFTAAFNGKTYLVESILLEDENFGDIQDRSGKTPLHYASAQDYQDTCRVILDFRIDLLDKQDFDGNTALHLAAYYGRRDVVDTLLKYIAMVDPKNSKGETPAMLAKNVKILKLFHCYGANFKIVDNACQNVLYHCCEGNKIKSVSWLKTISNRNVLSSLCLTKNIKGWNSLHVIASKGNVDILVVLAFCLTANDLKASDKTGSTPLDIAKISNQFTAQKKLLELFRRLSLSKSLRKDSSNTKRPGTASFMKQESQTMLVENFDRPSTAAVSSPVNEEVEDAHHDDDSFKPSYEFKHELEDPQKGWYVCLDFKTNKIFYFNVKSGISQWEKPAVEDKVNVEKLKELIKEDLLQELQSNTTPENESFFNLKAPKLTIKNEEFNKTKVVNDFRTGVDHLKKRESVFRERLQRKLMSKLSAESEIKTETTWRPCDSKSMTTIRSTVDVKQQKDSESSMPEISIKTNAKNSIEHDTFENELVTTKLLTPLKEVECSNFKNAEVQVAASTKKRLVEYSLQYLPREFLSSHCLLLQRHKKKKLKMSLLWTLFRCFIIENQLDNFCIDFNLTLHCDQFHKFTQCFGSAFMFDHVSSQLSFPEFVSFIRSACRDGGIKLLDFLSKDFFDSVWYGGFCSGFLTRVKIYSLRHEQYKTQDLKLLFRKNALNWKNMFDFLTGTDRSLTLYKCSGFLYSLDIEETQLAFSWYFKYFECWKYYSPELKQHSLTKADCYSFDLNSFVECLFHILSENNEIEGESVMPNCTFFFKKLNQAIKVKELKCLNGKELNTT